MKFIDPDGRNPILGLKLWSRIKKAGSDAWNFVTNRRAAHYADNSYATDPENLYHPAGGQLAANYGDQRAVQGMKGFVDNGAVILGGIAGAGNTKLPGNKSFSGLGAKNIDKGVNIPKGGAEFTESVTDASRSMGIYPEDISIKNSVANVDISFAQTLDASDMRLVSESLNSMEAKSVKVNSGIVIKP
ncbi:MAG: hypothetical protein AAGA77_11300 [Bacteroidota bacterium]